MTEFQAGAYRPASREEIASWLLGRGPIEDLGSYERAKTFASRDGRNSYGPGAPKPIDPWGDVAHSMPAGLRSAAEGAVGAGGDFSNLQGRLVQWILEKTGGSQEDKDRLRHITSNVTMWSRLPSSESIRRKITDPILGRNYQPQTTAGRYAYTGTEFLGGAFLPGGPIRKAAMVAVPAVASETAGQLTENTPWEPWARLFGALAGGGVAAVSPQRVAQTATAFARSSALADAKIALIRALQQRGYPLETIKRALANNGAAKGVADGQQLPVQFDGYRSFYGTPTEGLDTAYPGWLALERPEALGDNWEESIVAFLRQELDGSQPFYYRNGPAKWVGPLGDPHGPSITKPHRFLEKEKGKEKHHPVQQAAMRDIRGYNDKDAPAVRVEGPSTMPGTAHYEITQMQRRALTENIIDEVILAVDGLWKYHGLSPLERNYAAWELAQYLKFIRVTPETPIRVPGNRRKPK
ncbi:hypothetical protein MesoLjLc_22310 [Mesorhizobium sp. L-8-10]|uniref:hypothetical protein n=1 Tax=Mesorhizobium sp. L-8-10 TaxID=2744523 RepID=UPI0019267ED8|nr:hypothetical protein [Mesorhizobium sp. L-8-10]BCH30301.1 hypothetical protein MesoLjLc_22310 [Mesorhizobium sp. L-8-10]